MNFYKIAGLNLAVDGVDFEYVVYQSDPDSEYHPIGERKLRFFVVLPA
jgi:hypothetical protein